MLVVVSLVHCMLVFMHILVNMFELCDETVFSILFGIYGTDKEAREMVVMLKLFKYTVGSFHIKIF